MSQARDRLVVSTGSRGGDATHSSKLLHTRLKLVIKQGLLDSVGHKAPCRLAIADRSVTHQARRAANCSQLQWQLQSFQTWLSQVRADLAMLKKESYRIAIDQICGQVKRRLNHEDTRIWSNQSLIGRTKMWEPSLGLSWDPHSSGFSLDDLANWHQKANCEEPGGGYHRCSLGISHSL